MPGAKYMKTTLGGETQYYNILFLKKDIEEIKKYADENKITNAEVVRMAVSAFLEEKQE